MYEVNQPEPSHAFKLAWSAAGKHIERQSGGGLYWLRADLNPPMAEHLSFRMGNQLFFIFVEAAEKNFTRWGTLFMKVASAADAIPCIMKMRQRLVTWEPEEHGWGLLHAENNRPISPPALVSDALIAMTPWEAHDFSVQVVCNYLKSEGKDVLSKQPSLEIDPSIWFRDEAGANFVVVRAARYPDMEAPVPRHIDDITAGCAHMSQSGFFGSVSLSNADNPDLPLFRGHGLHARFSGLVRL